MNVTEIVKEHKLTLCKALMDTKKLTMFGTVYEEYQWDPVHEVVILEGREVSLEKLKLYMEFGLCSVDGVAH